jgi:thioesterase domain-containing protein
LDFGIEDARRLQLVYEAHWNAMRRYKPQPYAGRVILFQSEERSALPDPTMGWGKLTCGLTEVEIVPGKHSMLTRRPYVQTLADRIGKHLDNFDSAQKHGSPTLHNIPLRTSNALPNANPGGGANLAANL